jgi:tRNA threonylcarbamoyl adenosine modification protein YeaZ
MDINSSAQNSLDGPLLLLGAAEERLHLVLGERHGEELDLLAAQEWVVPARAMGFLVPALEQMFSLLDVRPSDLAGIACVRGPGSFTGIRIVLATAMGFMAGNNTPLAGLDHLHTLAVSAPPVQCATLAVLTYARRGQVYLQAFDAATRQPFSGPGGNVVALPAKQAAEALHALPTPVVALGTGLRRNPDVFNQTLVPEQILPPEFDTPKADVLLRMAAQADYARAPITPEYVRASDAEQNLEHIASLRGLSLEDARKRIDLSLEDMLQE